MERRESFRDAITLCDCRRAVCRKQKTRERLEAQKGLVDALSDYTRLARLQYNGGFVPYSTVLQAEQNLFPAELTLAQDRAQVFTALVSVYQSLGGGWVTIAEGMTTSAARPIAAQSPAASAGGSEVTVNDARAPSRLLGGTMVAE